MSRLYWEDDRWHLDGKPIHAGAGVEICWPDGTWQAVRIESGNAGRKLFAHFEHHGEEMAVPVCDRNQDRIEHTIRWPR